MHAILMLNILVIAKTSTDHFLMCKKKKMEGERERESKIRKIREQDQNMRGQ